MTTRKNCPAKFLSLLLVINGVVSFAISNAVLASHVDICVDVLDNITSPVNEYNCGKAFSIPPDTICGVNPCVLHPCMQNLSRLWSCKDCYKNDCEKRGCPLL